MRTLYLESVGGASGDMLLGALCGLGIDWDRFRAPLEAGLPELTVARCSVSLMGLTAWRLWGEVGHDVHERHVGDIVELVRSMELPDRVKERVLKAFHRLGQVEAAAHGCSIEHIHFHELGATDSIMDIVGFFWALELLGVERVEASPLKLGWGTVNTSHGVLPVPVPAVAALVEGLPVEAGPGPGELTTPTGALLIGQTAERFGALPPMRVLAQAMGAGGRPADHLNVVRAWLGETVGEATELVMLETNIDDMTPEQLAFARERFEAAGALDVTMLPGLGKKGRPAFLVQVLVPVAAQDATLDALFRHSSTLGVRRRAVERICLPRHHRTVELDGGAVRVKVATWSADVRKCEPEYEDCAAVSRATGRSLADVMAEARRLAVTS